MVKDENDTLVVSLFEETKAETEPKPSESCRLNRRTRPKNHWNGDRAQIKESVNESQILNHVHRTS